jgi:putative sigma-54 modulation protein
MNGDRQAYRPRARNLKLQHLFDRIVSCHVVVELASHHHHRGDQYHVSIHLGLPGREILVGHTPSDEQTPDTAYGAADRAFDEAGRQLEDWVKHQRTQRHDESANRRGR